MSIVLPLIYLLTDSNRLTCKEAKIKHFLQLRFINFCLSICMSLSICLSNVPFSISLSHQWKNPPLVCVSIYVSIHLSLQWTPCLHLYLPVFVSSPVSLHPFVSPVDWFSICLCLHLLLSVCLVFHQSLSMFTTVCPSLTICLHLHLFFSSTDCLSICMSVFVHLSLSISLEPSVVRWCFTQQRSVKIFYIL